jgi:Protein of unknown function (DUF3405)
MQALLFLTHRLDQTTIARYENIQLPVGFDRYLLLDARHAREFSRADVIEFSLGKLKSIGYSPITNTLVPGSNHFPVLEFSRNFPRYEYVWTMEYDVWFSGSWMTFFQAVDRPADLLTAKIRNYWDDPEWYWWRSIYVSVKPRQCSNPQGYWPAQALASFNPLYRLSRRAALHLRNECLNQGWIGHHELIMPTLLDMAEMIVEDFGTPPKGCGIAGKWYSEQTYSHDPIDFQLLAREFPNTLFHPVKMA